ncbi:hypothetical protein CAUPRSCDRAFT_13287 [Caulochytrium protostelioides]|nr:hypothetical protein CAUPRSCDRAFT_13287 [Caulochytrium protostelioides]
MGALELKSDENKSLRMVLQNHILLWDRTAKTILSFLRNTRLVNSSGVPRVVGVPMVTIVDDDAPPDEAWARMMDGPGSRSEPSASEPSASEPSASQSSAPPSARSAASSSPQS